MKKPKNEAASQLARLRWSRKTQAEKKAWSDYLNARKRLKKTQK